MLNLRASLTTSTLAVRTHRAVAKDEVHRG